MHYENIQEAVFIDRPNRFIAHVLVNGQLETVHVKNTGRCQELLQRGCRVFIQYFNSFKRKTKYDLIAVIKGNQIINVDSQAPNIVVREWLLANEPFGKITFLKPEYTYGKSRFDFYLELDKRKMFIEVKGVTLEEEGIVLFPDAPTERGLRHVEELMVLQEKGYEAAVIFVVQMEKASYFTPNRKAQPELADALWRAEKQGIQVLAYTCKVEADDLKLGEALEVKL